MNLIEHKWEFDQVFGEGSTDVGLYTPKARVKPLVEQGQAAQQTSSKLSPTYEWWWWANLTKYKEESDQIFGEGSPDVFLYTLNVRVESPADQGQAVQQALSKLPATYGWW